MSRGGLATRVRVGSARGNDGFDRPSRHSARQDRRTHRLLIGARDGDVAALRELASAVGPRLRRVAVLLVGETEASALTVRTFQVALAPFTTVPPAGLLRLSLFTYLVRLAETAPDLSAGLLALMPLRLRVFHALTQLEGFDYAQVGRICEVRTDVVRDGCAEARRLLVARHSADPAEVAGGVARPTATDSIEVVRAT